MSVAGISACGKYSPSDNSPVEVTLSAVIENAGIRTKAPFDLEKPTDHNPVTAAIWASTVSGSYQGTQKDPPASGSLFIDYHNSTCFTGEKKQLLDHQLFYPDNDSPVYFVGLCPRSADGWHAKEAIEGSGVYNVAHHLFYGNADVMFAKEVSNHLSTSSNPPELTFRHVLTWIQFNVVADNSEAIEAWGQVQKITIASNNEVNINLTSEKCSFAKSGTNELSAYCINNKGENTDVEFKDQKINLTTTSQPVAYTLCAPVDALPDDGLNEYSITIDTEYRPDTKVSINLKAADGSTNFSGNTEGCQFTVTLRFKLGENIVTTARATEWQNAGVGVTSVGEK